jgi:uncharacterized membrane protein YfcA
MSGTELAIVLAAVIVGSIVKAVTGMGLPIIAIPIAAMFVDIGDAVVVISLPNLLANGTLALQERRSFAETRDLPILVATGVVGAVGGTLLFVNLPEQPLVVALLVAIAAYIALFFLKPDAHTTAAQSRRWSPAVGALAGAFQGAIGISGPIVGSWIHSYRLPRSAHILSVTSLFLVSGGTQFAVLVTSGELSGRMVATLLACIPVMASIPIGTRLRNSFSVRGFDLAIVGILAMSSITLCLRTFL